MLEYYVVEEGSGDQEKQRMGGGLWSAFKAGYRFVKVCLIVASDWSKRFELRLGLRSNTPKKQLLSSNPIVYSLTSE